ncbi:kinase-like domain-containing protein [Irpex rosettiformis]|uniref:Kinase-like domain-containing protein n=1 Tax=Irpex rosettiformis TaxID=378272 RepID=A0ACB8UHB7_9APHY|nr:kinase-like domain-containing protein [Irpex rosettiformis]
MIDNWHHSNNTSPPYGFGFGPSSSYSSGSSTRSSHLSILTTPSSASALSRTSSSEAADHLPPVSPTTSSGSKTHAFFASPFSSTAPLPPEPFSAPAAAISKSSFFSADAEATPRMENAPAPSTSKKSLNDSFFSPSWQTSPLPPSSSSRKDDHESPPSSSSAMRVPLSRVFPSRVRYTSVDELPSREGSPQGFYHHHHHGALQATSPRLGTGRRHLVELDPQEYQAHHRINDSSHAQPSSVDDHIRDAQHGSDDGKHVHVHTPMGLEVARHQQRGSSKLPTPVEVSSSGDARARAQVVESPASMSENSDQSPKPVLRPGDVIVEPTEDGEEESDAKLHLVLVKTLGQGAFSSVWLARDETGRVSKLEVSRKNSLKRQKSKRGSLRRSGTGAGSLRRRNKRASESSEDGYGAGAAEEEMAMDGTVPKIKVTGEEGSDGRVGPTLKLGLRSGSIGRGEVEGANVGRLVALKMTDKSLCDKDDRTRVSFVREVEVLKHIAHPSIVAYIHAFSTPSHHILVLEHVAGGELFDLVSSQEIHARLSEPLLRRIFGELCRAVAWMHAVGLIHRDIKLENILLTRDVFTDPTSTSPLIKISDFGLSRFIDPSSPLLTTRCGSESYAAPELVTGRPYDGRETDAWACGVVMYALVTRRLPFDAMNPPNGDGGGALKTDEGHGQGTGMEGGKRPKGPRRDERSERRALLMRIANGQYSWPELPKSSSSSESETEPRGLELVRSEGVRRVVGRLLVRDPRKRAKVAQLWEDEWMNGEGAPSAPVLPEYPASAAQAVQDAAKSPLASSVSEAWDVGDKDVWDEDMEDEEFDDEEVDEEEEEDGVLVDEHDIAGSVACQEVLPP